MRLLVTMSERSTMAPVCLWSRQASARAQVTTAIQLQLSTIVGITNETHDHLEPERDGETAQGVATSPSGSSAGAATTAGCSLSAAAKPNLIKHVLIVTAAGGDRPGRAA